MPEIASDTTVASCYPPESLYSQWCTHASKFDMSVSQFLIRMVEAGRKQLDTDSLAIQSMQELREERNNLRREVERERARVEELEQQLDRTAHADVVGVIEENPGVSAPEVIQHIADSVPGRTVGLLDTLEGERIRESDGEYYPLDEEDRENRDEETIVEEEGRGG